MHSDSKRAELTDLLTQLCDGCFGQSELDRVEQLLLDDPEAQTFYRRYIALDVELAGSVAGLPAVSPPPASSPVLGFLGAARRDAVGFFSQEMPLAYLTAAPLVGLLLLIAALVPVSHHTELARQFDAPAPSAAKPLPFAEAEQPVRVARITGMVDCRWERKGLGIRDWGLEKGSGVRGQGSGLPSPAGRGAGGEGTSNLPSPAGRGAGGEGTQSPIPNPQSPVRLGDKFALASGLLQLTYDTGAKVILQGPCTYEVESPTGGFLSLGKLTARVESGERRVEREEKQVVSGQWSVAGKSNIQHPTSNISNPQSLIPNPSSSPFPPPPSPFVVKTPTAVVTDLGTEFGVEVDAQRDCHVETFVGLVKVSSLAGGSSDDGRQVAAGEALRVDSRGLMATAPIKPKHFVCNMQREEIPYVKAVLEDRPVAYWRLADAPSATWIADRSGHSYSGRVCGTIRLGQSGPLDDPRSRAAEFDGHGYIELHNTPNFDAAKGFSIEAWARCAGAADTTMAAVAWRDEHGPFDLAGFTLFALPTNVWFLQIGTGIAGQTWQGVGGPGPAPGEWAHLVGAFEPTGRKENGSAGGVARLYVNGKLVESASRQFAANRRQPLRIGAGATESPDAMYSFVGRLAEIALYDRPLGEDRIKAHWETGRKEGKQ